jgi:hypothetical protein
MNGDEAASRRAEAALKDGIEALAGAFREL